MTRAGLPLWLASATVRRIRGAWRLIAVILAIAVTSCTLVTSVGLLVFSTEQGGLRSALSSIPSRDSDIDVYLLRPTVSVKEGVDLADTAIHRVLGGAATTRQDTVAVSEFLPTPALDRNYPALGYYGEFDAIKAHSTLVGGAWPNATTLPNGSVPVALPEAAAKAWGLGLGSTFSTVADGAEVTAEVAGLYRAVHPNDSYWSRDPLSGAGYKAGFPKPDVTLYVPTNGFGPMLVAPGALAKAHLPAHSYDIHYRPDFRRITADQFPPLLERLAEADQDVILHIGLVARGVVYTTNLAEGADAIGTSLVVTRSTVVVVTLLLLVLTLAALAQTARLSNDAAADERRVMRARGASGGQLLALAGVEAVVIGVITALVSPPLASLVYRALAAQPPMVAARMPADAGLPAVAWFTAAWVSLAFAVVLMLPLLRRQDRLADASATKHRLRRSGGLMRSGLDLGLVALAIVVYWQLQSYRSPVDLSASLGVDPVLVAGPAVMLVAGGLVAVRLIPLASRLLERFGQRSRGAVVTLGVWEVSRRTQKITAAVLLLTLALSVGTFSQTFLATWRQSQTDQATLVIGAPVRVPADGALGAAELPLLVDGALGRPQPVIRRLGALAPAGSTAYAEADGNPSAGSSTAILGLTPADRALISRDRLGSEGGTTIRTALAQSPALVDGVALPGTAVGIGLTVRAGDDTAPLAKTTVGVNAILQDANGLFTTLDLGSVPADGQQHALEGLLSARAKGAAFATPLTLVGLQSSVVQDDDSDIPADQAAMSSGFTIKLMFKDLTALQPAAKGADAEAPLPRVALQPSGVSWTARNPDPYDQAPVLTEDGEWPIVIDALLPASHNSGAAHLVLTSWNPALSIPAVISRSIADRLHVVRGMTLDVALPGTHFAVSVTGIAPLVPGSTSGIQPDAATDDQGGQPDTVVVDHAALSRVLVASGAAGPLVDEWWIDVAPGHGQAYLQAHPTRGGVAPAESSEVRALQLQQDPMRVSAQAALWLAILGAGLLAIAGFAVHTSASLRSRRTELAQLRAIGLSRRMLVGLVGAEAVMVSVVSSAIGIGLGVLLGWLVGPLIAVSPSGAPTLPSVRVIVPWVGIALLAAVILAVVALAVVGIARAQRTADPASILRGADE
ncbi:MAG TPA: ABC transporter permease [Lacisediminihabitans sp.]|nr:ABC transporter permease [Lacisediminihabitans sp.]HXD61380.1 ABC transporter permease [Lacisediminihabitans sp.]